MHVHVLKGHVKFIFSRYYALIFFLLKEFKILFKGLVFRAMELMGKYSIKANEECSHGSKNTSHSSD